MREGAAAVDLYDPRLQSPEYGGGASRDRYVPAVRVPPPAGRPAWTFESRTLLEFPPAVSDGLAVIGTNSGRVYAARRRRRLGGLGPAPEGEIASSPAIAGGRAIVGSMGGQLVAYGVGAGTPLWTFSTGSPIESSPLIVDGLVYVGTWAGGLYAVDAATGKQRWRYQAPDDIKGSAALANGLIVVGDYSGNLHALDPRSGAERWTYTGGARFYGGPAVSGDTIVIGDVGGAVIALDARSGGERWRHSTGGAYVYSTAAIADGAAYIGSYNGSFQALDLGDGSVRWSFDVGGRISGSATVVDGVVYTARLYAPGSRGAPTGSTRGPAPCASRPTRAATRPPWEPGGRCTSWARGTCMPTLPRRRKRLWLGLAGLAAALLIAGGVLAFGLARGWFDPGSVEGTTEGFEAAEAPAGRPRRGRGLSTGTTPSGRGRTRRSACGPPSGRVVPRCRLADGVPPVLGGGRAVVGTNAGLAMALDLDGGRRLWSVRLRGRVASSPALAGDLALLTTIRGDVVALRAADGRQVWRRRVGSAVESSPLVVEGSVPTSGRSRAGSCGWTSAPGACAGAPRPRGTSRPAWRCRGRTWSSATTPGT